jgi:phospholipid/cholesterol/gamma-HCH transport system substrate-binding protein
MKFKFRHADKIVGLFALLAIVFLILIAVFAGVNKKWFTKKVHYTSLFTSAEGLKVGMGVNLRGFEIGRVKNFELNEDNQVDLDFYIYETYHDRVRPDTVLALPSGLLGSAGALDLYPGLAEGAPLVDGTYIPSTQTVDGKLLVKTRKVDRPEGGDPITDILARLPEILDNLNDTVVDAGDLLGSLDAGIKGDGDDALSTSMRHVQGITYGLEVTIQDVNSITASLASLSAELEDPTGLVPKLLDPQGSLDTLLNDNNVLWENILSILEELDGAMAGINDLSSSLAGVSPQLALTLDEVIRALQDAQKVMEGLQNNPLLRKGITPETPPVNPGTDTREEDF